jgi:S-adenosyl-L-methionine hydrolase (adenosine-forming)
VPPARPPITLLTDFGDRDWFVASMKGAILSTYPEARIVDLTHQIAPHRIDEAAYFLMSCYREFPEGTIHVVVVDPGVGSARRAIAVKSARYFFLGPDNGVLTYIFHDEQPVEVREIDQQKFRHGSPGRTFDGRDLFAPAAARLATHEPFESYGPVIEDYRKCSISHPRWELTALVGEIVYVDRFGNLMSNLTAGDVIEAQEIGKWPHARIRIAGHTINRLVGSYDEGLRGELSGLINSNGVLEVFLKEDSAAQWLKVGLGTEIIVA